MIRRGDRSCGSVVQARQHTDLALPGSLPVGTRQFHSPSSQDGWWRGQHPEATVSAYPSLLVTLASSGHLVGALAECRGVVESLIEPPSLEHHGPVRGRRQWKLGMEIDQDGAAQ